MDLNQSKQRPVGRGALLRRLVAENNASSASNSDESRSCTSKSTSIDSLLDTSTASDVSFPDLDTTKDSLTETGYPTQGRGQLLQRILLAGASISNDSFKLEAAPKPYGSGRGKMLKMLSEANKQAESYAEEIISSIDDGVESLSIGSAEEEPVIKRGTKGSYFDRSV